MKPFSLRELVTRVRALLRSTGPNENDVIKVGQLEIDSSSMTIRLKGQAVLCTVKEFRLAGIPGESPRPQVQQAAIADAVGNDTAFVTQRSMTCTCGEYARRSSKTRTSNVTSRLCAVLGIALTLPLTLSLMDSEAESPVDSGLGRIRCSSMSH